MPLPVICGTIDRRILINFRVEPEAAARLLPAPFRPQLVQGWAMAGVCLIRLKNIRPKFMPLPIGIGSENAAHRIAVEWDEDGQVREGVFIPRRDTSSLLNTWAGGRVFPGMHHHARFQVHEADSNYRIAVDSYDRGTHLAVAGSVARELPADSVFASLDAAVEFFRRGSLGYSTTTFAGCFDGLELRCDMSGLAPLTISHIESSYFDDASLFPPGSVHFDSALLMRNIEHEWHGHPQLVAEPVTATPSLEPLRA